MWYVWLCGDHGAIGPWRQTGTLRVFNISHCPWCGQPCTIQIEGMLTSDPNEELVDRPVPLPNNTAARRSEGAKFGWEIRKAKQAERPGQGEGGKDDAGISPPV